MKTPLQLADEKFRAHCKECVVCSSGAFRVCDFGLELLRWFQQALSSQTHTDEAA